MLCTVKDRLPRVGGSSCQAMIHVSPLSYVSVCRATFPTLTTPLLFEVSFLVPEGRLA